MTTEKRFDKLIAIIDAVIIHLDDHLKNEHKMEATGYNSETKAHATTRWYLQNCSKQLRDLRDEE